DIIKDEHLPFLHCDCFRLNAGIVFIPRGKQIRLDLNVLRGRRIENSQVRPKSANDAADAEVNILCKGRSCKSSNGAKSEKSQTHERASLTAPRFLQSYSCERDPDHVFPIIHQRVGYEPRTRTISASSRRLSSARATFVSSSLPMKSR